MSTRTQLIDELINDRNAERARADKAEAELSGALTCLKLQRDETEELDRTATVQRERADELERRIAERDAEIESLNATKMSALLNRDLLLRLQAERERADKAEAALIEARRAFCVVVAGPGGWPRNVAVRHGWDPDVLFPQNEVTRG